MGKYHQSKYEQEVTIGFNAAEGTAEIYTADPDSENGQAGAAEPGAIQAGEGRNLSR